MTQANNVAIESSQINSSGVLQPAGGGTGASSLTANNVLLGNGTSAVQTVAPGTSGNILTSNGTTWTSATPGASGATITGTTTTGTYYIVGTTSTSGALSTASISNTNTVAYNANTGVLQTNGGFQANSAGPFFLNATTVSANYTIPSSYNAMTAGKVTINTGITVTVSTGSRWVIV